MRFAVHNLSVTAIAIDDADSYEIQPGGPRFVVQPLSMGDGPAIFPEFDEAEEWRVKRLAEIGPIGAQA